MPSSRDLFWSCCIHCCLCMSLTASVWVCAQELTAERAHEVLKAITDDDCRALGFDPKWSRPDWMVLTVFPVPPPAVRPSVMMDGTNR